MIAPILPWNAVTKLPGNVVLCDVRYTLQKPDGYPDFLEGHIPGARYVSMDDVLAGTAGPGIGRHPLPSPEHFAHQIGQLGIGTEDIVVGYDQVGGRFAGRLVWMLRILGQSATLLDGGLQAWQDQHPDSNLEKGPANFTGVARPVLDWPQEAIVTADQVAEAIAAGVRVFDSRDPRRYAGEFEPMDPKAGHVPGALSLPFADNYQPESHYLRSTAELRQRMEKAQVDGQSIFYCGSGVTACNNVLAAEAAGLPRPRVYVGSWSGWSTEDRPVETSTT